MRVLNKGTVCVQKKTLSIRKPTKDHSESAPESSDVPATEEESLCDVTVIGVPRNIEEDILAMLFENEGRSGGGDVTNLVLDRSNGVAMVTFQDPAGKKYTHAFESVD